MDPEVVLATLLDAGVLSSSGETLRLSDSFCALADEWQASLDSPDDPALGAELGPLLGEDHAAALVESAGHDTAFLGRVAALAELTEGLSVVELVRTDAVLDQLRSGIPTEGVPASFLPVRGDRLAVLLDHTPLAVVYVWRHDCPPCEAMEATLETVFPEPPDDIGLFAVYGPDWAELLHDDYDVPAGPATLFMIDGSVDARLYGAKPTDAVETEVDVLRQSVEP